MDLRGCWHRFAGAAWLAPLPEDFGFASSRPHIFNLLNLFEHVRLLARRLKALIYKEKARPKFWAPCYFHSISILFPFYFHIFASIQFLVKMRGTLQISLDLHCKSILFPFYFHLFPQSARLPLAVRCRGKHRSGAHRTSSAMVNYKERCRGV